jgi:thioredoxin 2
VRQAAETFAGRLKAVKVNVDEAPALAQRFRANSIPMILILRDGEPRRKQVGALAPTPLVNWVKDALEQP